MHQFSPGYRLLNEVQVVGFGNITILWQTTHNDDGNFSSGRLTNPESQVNSVAELPQIIIAYNQIGDESLQNG